MLAVIEKDTSVSAILVYSYDRFSRSGANGIFLLEKLKKLGVKIIAVTQEFDSFTPTGNIQENLYMLLSKLDNDMRRDKSISSTKSIIKKGYWPYATPVDIRIPKNMEQPINIYTLSMMRVNCFAGLLNGKHPESSAIRKL
jgi:DNA invertase Pin-like site-specific DNA recombinase